MLKNGNGSPLARASELFLFIVNKARLQGILRNLRGEQEMFWDEKHLGALGAAVPSSQAN